MQAHLNNHHRDTVEKIFSHPTSRNIEWRQVLSLLETIGTAFFLEGAFGTPLLQTPGTMAVSTMSVLTLLVTLLLMFYTVESLRREQGTGLASIHYATPIRTSALLFGKALANSFVGVVIVLTTLVACLIVIVPANCDVGSAD